MVYAVSDD